MIVELKERDLCLEIGVGTRKIHQQSIAIDKSPHSKADIFRDCVKRGIPFNNEFFDVICCFEMIEHIEHYEDLIFFFNEVYRVMKDGAKFYISTPNGLQGYEHITHHRVFSQGSFDYFRKELSPEMQYMRLSDGIIAEFDIECLEHAESETCLELILTK